VRAHWPGWAWQCSAAQVSSALSESVDSRERLPRQAARLPVLSAGQAAALVASAIEKGSRTLIAPSTFRLLFLLNRLFPRRTEALLCKPR